MSDIKMGDYISTNNTVLMHVVAIVQGESKIYGFNSIKNPDIRWFTEQEVIGRGLEVTEYTPGKFKNIRTGDIVHMGEDQYVKVLARVGDAVLLSKAKDPSATEFVSAMDHLAEGLGINVLDDEAREHISDHGKMTKMTQTADDWYDIEFMNLMNWRVVEE